jgi:hypothetical protein
MLGVSKSLGLRGSAVMNDDLPLPALEQLRSEHRALDEQIQALLELGGGDQLEVARLKKRKLRIKDQIHRLMDASIPDIIA